MKWVVDQKTGRLIQKNNILEEGVVGIGWLCGFIWNRGVRTFGQFMYDWMYAPRMAHSRAAGILLLAIIFFGMLCIL